MLISIDNKLNNFIEVYNREEKRRMDDHEDLEERVRKLEPLKEVVRNNEKTVDDHENRLRFVERAIFICFGALAILQVVLKFFFK